MRSLLLDGDRLIELIDYVFVDEHNRHKRLKGLPFLSTLICRRLRVPSVR